MGGYPELLPSALPAWRTYLLPCWLLFCLTAVQSKCHVTFGVAAVGAMVCANK